MRRWIQVGSIAAASAFCALALSEGLDAERQAPSRRVVEIRSYNLKPGTRDRFHQTFLKEALPMLERWKVDVVSYGPSLHDQDSYFLMRGFEGIDQRQKSEDAFYGSAEWKQGPRERILADIDSYTTIVVSLDADTINGLRKAGGVNTMANHASAASDLDVLTRLNADYITSVQKGDVKRFDEILADDFLCSMADGSLIDRQRFLEVTAQPVTIRNLQAHDVNIRLMGDMAIVHAATSFTTADGRPSSGRYTDVWARRGGQWLAVSAHVTRK
jgi:ketosteroid isomerase-like protein